MRKSKEWEPHFAPNDWFKPTRKERRQHQRDALVRFLLGRTS